MDKEEELPKHVKASMAFDKELAGLIDKYREEWTITYASIVGVLTHHTGKMLEEWRDQEREPLDNED